MRIVYWLVVWIGGLGVNAFDLQCSSVGERNFLNFVTVNTCFVKNMNITQKGSIMTSATSITDIDSVKGLFIRLQTVNFMPRFDGIAQRIELLRISSCHLKSIDREDLQQFPNLIGLVLIHSDLTSLPANLFEFNEKLEGINFQENKLKFIGANILQPLKNLKRAYFDQAGCINMHGLTPAMIETLKSELLTKCKTKKASKDSAEKSESEEQISDLKREISQLKLMIVKLERKNEESQKEANEVKLKLQQSLECASDNAALVKKLKVCDKMLDAATKNLAPLLTHADSSSSDNRTVDVLCENFTSAAKVCEAIGLSIEKPATAIGSVKDQTGEDISPTNLIIQQQPMLFLPINLAEVFPDLVELEVSSSGIFVLDRRTFKGLDKLTNLNLTSNKLLNIASGSFSDLKKLATLDLSHNNFESIEFGSFEGLDAVTFLDLNGNKLKEIATKFMLPMKSLESLDLLGNVCVDLKYPETALEAIKAAILENCTAPNKIMKVKGLGVGQSSADVIGLLNEDQVENILPQRQPMH